MAGRGAGVAVKRIMLAGTCLLAFGAAPAAAGPIMQVGFVKDPDLVVRAGRVLPVEGAPIDDGVVVVRDGRIESVGPAAGAVAALGSSIIHLPDAWLVPGFVDLHCHVAGTDINDMVHPTNTDLRVLDQIVPGNENLLDALAGGVTTILFIPGSGTNLGGFGALLKTAGRDLDEMLVRFPGAMKIAQAGNPERRSGELGRGRMGMNWSLRETLLEGRLYHEAWTAFEEGRSQPKPARIERLELLRGLFRHDFPVIVHTQWAPVFQSSIRMLHDEFGLWTILSHATFDSYVNTPLLVERDMFVNLGPRSYHQDYDSGEIVGLGASYKRRGLGHLSINTDSPVVPQQELSLQAALAVRYGLAWEDALRALTIEPATAIGIADRVGSIEPGKDADLVLWSGDPLDPRSHVLVTISGGRIALDQRVPENRRW